MQKIVIIGAGTGGIMVASQLRKAAKDLEIVLIDPSEKHFYQPAWTLVGAGTFSMKKTERKTADFIPTGVQWIKERVAFFYPEQNEIALQSGKKVSYDRLVVATGLVMEPSWIEGLQESLGKGVVCSNYTDPEHTWKVLQNFKGGNAVFTQPTTPIKCGGAPQKIAYLAADYLKKNGLSAKSNVVFATPGSVLFGVKEIRETLQHVVDRYGIHFKPFYAPVKVDGENRKITFRMVHEHENQCVVNEDNELNEVVTGESFVEMPFDMLHIAPPQAAPKFVRDSVLANENGWLDVDIHSLQHKRFKNVYGLGDVAALPTAKTGAAIRKQTPVLVDGLLQSLKGQESQKRYNGYSSCPLVTGYGKMVLAEFNYEGQFTPDPKLKQMLVFDSHKEHWRLWMLKKYMLPDLYWRKMMRGQQV